MIDSVPAWSNAVLAMPTGGPFLADLGQAVANDSSAESGARFLLARISDFLRSQGQPSGPIAAFDFAIVDIEAIDCIWPAFRRSAELYDLGSSRLPDLARFLVDRLPALWRRSWAGWHAPTTRALALADRIDTLVDFFAIGLAPNGSKDPFALRRAANEVLNDILFSVRVA